ncbi:MAG: PAS domain S-box protein [Nitrospirae bacterium]|nr:MAG: PAS domain S-box protein [Nitrospirota bacterium]
MTEKSKYLEEQIARILQFWIGIVLFLAISLFLLLGIMDYFVTPENFEKFGIYRLSISVVLVFLYYLNRLKKNRNYQYTIITIMVILSAITIELMILQFGGHRSSYYAGLNLLIIAALGLIPYSLSLSISIASVIYAMYIIPILILDKVTDIPAFVSNNAFMLSTFIIALTWRILTQKTMFNELSFQYDLEQERRKLEDIVEERTKELYKSELMLRSLFENANDGIMIMDENGIILDLNQKACDMHGFDRKALVGVNIELLEREENKQLFRERMERILNGEALMFETQHYRKDGSKVSLEISSKAIEVGGQIMIQSFHRDITQKKKLQEHLFQSQKMESIGSLAGGIAHDFNNVLTGILGQIELMRMTDVLEEKTIKRLNVIESAARKASVTISKLLGFARRSNYEILPLDLNAIVGDTVKLLGNIVDKKISMRLELGDNLPLIEGDVNQMEQVLMNLIVNARDAMPDGGVILIKTSRVDVEKGRPDIPPYIEPGKYILLRVSDSGCGMPEDIISKIFEPFFTTKERGKGTGLGLSMVYGIIKDHQGHISVRSRINEGSIFDIYMPASDKKAHAFTGRSFAFPRGGAETILVVEDDEHAMSFIREALEMHGYNILVANNPVSAIDIFQKASDHIALVVTDIIMPLMDGMELTEHIRSKKPTARILAISGYSKYAMNKNSMGVNGFLQKPFGSEALLSSVRQILDIKDMDITIN